ncbi:hypothetical protein SCUCBS95973_000907 [Sporothrix curviconia]|uniref:BTB domain-containing protein n=1 Tax=Sporothrix curviconia TaxID=1260050 RepID=A0ABP0AU65_9PEZI
MSAHLFLDSSLSLFGGMDVGGGGADSGAGADDWTQHESLFNSPPRQLHLAGTTLMPPPPPSASAAGPSQLSRTLSANANSSSPGAVNSSNNSNNNSSSSSGGCGNSNFLAASPLAGTAATPSSNNNKQNILGQTPSTGAQGRVISPRPFSYIKQSSAQRDSMSHSVNGAPTTAGGAAPNVATSARTKEREQLLSGPLMFRQPLSIATIAINGREFYIHAELLCKHSDYFTRCLRGGFAEAETQRVEINDDISVDDFGLWIDLLYRSHFQKPDTFVLRKEETGGTLSTMQILTLWKLSDRFLHKPLAALAEESLQHRLSLYSVEQWRKLYRTRPASDIRSRVSRLQDAYRFCCDQDLPFVNDIVTACANCPAQVYADCASLLEVDFMMLVSQRMIMAHADNQLVSKEQRLSSTNTGAKPSGGGMSDVSGFL